MWFRSFARVGQLTRRRLGKISRQGDEDLRQSLVLGATAVIQQVERRERASQFARDSLLEEAGFELFVPLRTVISELVKRCVETKWRGPRGVSPWRDR